MPGYTPFSAPLTHRGIHWRHSQVAVWALGGDALSSFRTRITVCKSSTVSDNASSCRVLVTICLWGSEISARILCMTPRSPSTPERMTVRTLSESCSLWNERAWSSVHSESQGVRQQSLGTEQGNVPSQLQQELLMSRENLSAQH